MPVTVSVKQPVAAVPGERRAGHAIAVRTALGGATHHTAPGGVDHSTSLHSAELVSHHDLGIGLGDAPSIDHEAQIDVTHRDGLDGHWIGD